MGTINKYGLKIEIKLIMEHEGKFLGHVMRILDLICI